MKKLLILLIPLMLVSYNVISQNVILDSITAVKVIKDLERLDSVKSENSYLLQRLNKCQLEVAVTENIVENRREVIRGLREVLNKTEKQRKEESYQKNIYKKEVRRQKTRKIVFIGVAVVELFIIGSILVSGK